MAPSAITLNLPNVSFLNASAQSITPIPALKDPTKTTYNRFLKNFIEFK